MLLADFQLDNDSEKLVKSAFASNLKFDETFMPGKNRPLGCIFFRCFQLPPRLLDNSFPSFKPMKGIAK